MMEKTWRWFGKKDKITLPMLRQIGVEGIVTALHDVPNGEIWTMEAINDLKSYIESYGLRCPYFTVRYIMQGSDNSFYPYLSEHRQGYLVLFAEPSPCLFHHNLFLLFITGYYLLLKLR